VGVPSRSKVALLLQCIYFGVGELLVASNIHSRSAFLQIPDKLASRLCGSAQVDPAQCRFKPVTCAFA
jgi:hypothetical protein